MRVQSSHPPMHFPNLHSCNSLKIRKFFRFWEVGSFARYIYAHENIIFSRAYIYAFSSHPPIECR